MTHSRYAPDTLGPAPSWETFAACKDADPDVFFDERVDVAVGICQGCPVRDACLAEALAREGRTPPYMRFGIFGGLGPRDRYGRATGRRVKNGRPPADCGSDAAYRRHIKNGEPVDEPCRNAHRQYALANYHQSKARPAAGPSPPSSGSSKKSSPPSYATPLPAPRRLLPAQERPMTATATVVLAMHHDGYSDQQIADARHIPVDQVTRIIDADRAQPPTPTPPGVAVRPRTPVDSLGDLADLLGWAVGHDDPTLHQQAAQVHAAVAALQQRRRNEAELARVTSEAAELEKLLAAVRARQAELQPAPAKPRRTKPVDYPIAEVRAWARQQGMTVPAAGRLAASVVEAWRARDTAS